LVSNRLEIIQQDYICKESYKVVINEAIVPGLKKFNKNDKERLNKALNDLQYKHWDLGIRVKKLKGLKEPVFEARLDQSRRILFIIKKLSLVDTNDIQPCIVIQDIVRHKKVNQQAKNVQSIERLNLTSSAANLLGDVEKAEEIFELDSLEHTLENFEYFNELTQDFLNDKSKYDDLSGLPSGIRYYVFNENERLEWILNGDYKLELALSMEQNSLRYQDGPLFINGAAGTGKTTILTYKLFDMWLHQSNKVLFITYNKSLSEFIKGLLFELNGNEKLGNTVFTLNDVEKKILGSQQEKYDFEKKIDLNEFLKWDIKKKMFDSLDPVKVWEEIRSIIKGSCTNKELGIISLKEYQQMGKKRTIFLNKERDKVYHIAEKYQIWLKSEGYWDELDLTQHAIEKLKITNERDKIHGIICDEVQDLSEIQYIFLYLLLGKKYQRNIFFAGDTQQIINPSGFRWEDVRKSMYNFFKYKDERKSVNDIFHLLRNYRCSLSMINFANNFIEKKWQIFGKNVDEYKQKGIKNLDRFLVHGYLLTVPKKSIHELFDEVRMSRRRMLIVNSSDTKSSLKNKLKSEFILQIEEIKGLEFDATFLYNVATDTNLDWRKLISSTANYFEDNYHKINHEFNKIYVAITRAKRHIAIYEEDEYAVEFWKLLIDDRNFAIATVETMKQTWNQPQNKEEWMEDALYFHKLSKYLVAAECYQGAGELPLAMECKALFHRQLKNFEDSAKLFLKLDKKDEAAKDYELCKPIEAIPLFQELRDIYGEKRCRARIAEKTGNFKDAGTYWEEAERYQYAVNAFTLGKLSNDARRCQAKLHEQYNEWRDAANEWNFVKNNEREYYCWFKHYDKEKKWNKAAEYLELQYKWNQASNYWVKAKNEIRSKFCNAKDLDLQGEWKKAGIIYEEILSYPEAIESWTKSGDTTAVIRCQAKYFEIKSEFTKAYQSWLKIDYLEEAFRCLQKTEYNAKQYLDLESQLFIKQGRFKEAADNLSLISRSIEKKSVIENYNKAGEHELAILFEINCSVSDNTLNDSIDLTTSDRFKQSLLALKMEKEENWEEAAELWYLSGNFPQAKENYLKRNNKKMTIQSEIMHLEKLRQFYPERKEELILVLIEYYKEINELEKVGTYYELIDYWIEAAKTWEEMEYWEKAIKNWKKREKTARINYCMAKIKERDGDLEEAAMLFQKHEFFTEAIHLWKIIGNLENEKTCIALIYEIQDQLDEAYEIWMEIKNYDKARQNLVKAKKSIKHVLQHELRVSINEKDIEEIIFSALLLGDISTALIHTKKTNVDTKYRDIQIIEKLVKQDWKELAHLTSKFNEHLHLKSNALRFEQQQKWDAAARIWHQLKDYPQASYAYRLAGFENESIEMEIQYIKSKQLVTKVDQNQLMKCLTTLGKFEEVAHIYQEQGDWNKAADTWLQIDMTELAINCLMKTGNYPEIAKIEEKRENFQYAAKYWKKADDMQNYIKNRLLYLNDNEHNWKEVSDLYTYNGQVDIAKDIKLKHCYSSESEVGKLLRIASHYPTVLFDHIKDSNLTYGGAKKIVSKLRNSDVPDLEEILYYFKTKFGREFSL